MIFFIWVQIARFFAVVKPDDLAKTIQDMCQEIKFEVFCAKLKAAYVGDSHSAEYIQGDTVEQVSKSISFIKIEFRSSTTNKIMVTTPDMV